VKCGGGKIWRRKINLSCEKLRNIALSLGGQEYLTYSQRRKANWIGHILRRNCLLKHVNEEKIEGSVEVTRR
jgi:hypothetical protein